MMLWVFLVISFKGPNPAVLGALDFKTEQECRAYEVQRAPLPGIAVGCLPKGKVL